MTDSVLQAFMQECEIRVNRALETWLPPAKTHPEELHRAMRYAALSGGKRIRPILVYASGRAVGLESKRLDGPACAVELIHSYSLVHDDLPAMDDDDLRRGQPTCHKAFDEAMAILAGDALQTLAFYVLSNDQEMQAGLAERLRMIEHLACASGSRGMVGGQALDLDAVGKELDLVELENMHIHKTGALIRASVRLGTLLDPAVDPETMRRLDRYAKCVGLAFQIRDDILDVEGETATLGKTRGKDHALNKPTYPALLGLAEAREKAQSLCLDAIACLGTLGPAADPLRALASFIVRRTR